jgi:hypothetical protein
MHSRAVTLSLLFLALLTTVTPTFAVCSNASLKGVYGYFHGRYQGGAVLRAIVGQFTADGVGGLSGGKWTMSFNGAITTGSFLGSYNVASDCTGFLNFSTEDFTPANFNITLDNNHNGFQMIQTNNNTAQPGFGVAQGVVVCGVPGKKHIYATNVQGTLFPSLDIEAFSGKAIFDGTGKILGNETFTIAGVISVNGLTGTYTEAADCTGTAQITPDGLTTMNFNTVKVNGGKELLMIETDNNTLIAGTAQQ